MRAKTIVCATAATGAALTAALSRPADAGPSSDDRPFFLTSFLQSGRTDVYRNEVLEFRFSTPVRKSSVSLRTLQVNEVTAAGRKPATGARIVSGNVVRFDPRRSQLNYDTAQQPNATTIEVDNPEGMTGLAAHEVRLPVGPDPWSAALHGRSGRRLAQPYVATFGTSIYCIDPYPGQPSFVGDHGTGLLGFEPPRSGASGLVDETAAIVLEFSEPILSASLVLGSTVRVTRTIDGKTVAGAIVPDGLASSGRRFLFVPTGGWGFDASGNGWDLRVEVTTGVTDLAGNPLKRPVQFPAFRTRSLQ